MVRRRVHGRGHPGQQNRPRLWRLVLGPAGLRAQQYDGHADPNRPNNLYEPVDEQWITGRTAISTAGRIRHSLQLWADQHREWIALAGVAGGVYDALQNGLGKCWRGGLIGLSLGALGALGLAALSQGRTPDRRGQPADGRCSGAGDVPGQRWWRHLGAEVGRETLTPSSTVSREGYTPARLGGSGMTTAFDLAPGVPGTPARWASAAKTGVGTALNPVSDVWFTLSHGIVTEVFHPFVDMACTRDLELLVTDRQEFFSEEKRDTQSQGSYLSDGVPAFRLVNTCAQGRYRLEKLVLTDPCRSTVLQQVQFVPLKGELADYSVYVLLSPHLGNQGGDNSAWIGDYKGVPMLFAQRSGLALALACSAPGGSARRVSSAPPTAGRTCPSTSRWTGATSGPSMATWP